MPHSDSQFTQLMTQVEEGSQDAAWELIEQYGPHIHRVVRRRLNKKMRQRYDSTDFLQSVWKSFFRRPSRMAGFEHPEQLIRHLVVMARNKVVDEVRREATQARDASREEPLEWEDGPREELAAVRDTPSQIAMARECWNGIMDQLPPHGRKVVQLRITGATYVEIAESLQMNERTARRVIDRLMRSLATAPPS